jgi:Uma2 family endonuclease
MSTATIAVTPDDLLRMPDEGQGWELVRGELREMNVSKESSRVSARITHFLEVHSESVAPGWVFPDAMSFRCFEDPSTIRRADAAWIPLSKMPVDTYEDEGYCTVVPDIVAEVVSPNDLAEEVEEKLEDWLGAGVKLVWIVHPVTRTIRVHRAGGGIAYLQDTDTLTAEGVLSNFAVPVVDLFRRPGEQSTQRQ